MRHTYNTEQFRASWTQTDALFMEEVPGNMVFDFDFNFEALLRTEQTQQKTNRKEESTVSFHDIYVQKGNKQKIINIKETCAETVNNNLKQKKGRN